MIDFYEFFLYIIIYSFLGWCCEVSYAYKNQKKFVNRGFLHGPICPIYGVCTMTLISLLHFYKGNIFILFILSTIIVSTIEYLTGYLLEKTFKTKYWDYTEDPLNLHGKICLHFSLMWGILATLTIKVIHPFIVKSINYISYNSLMSLFLLLFIIFIIDLLITLSPVTHIKRFNTMLQLDYFNIKNMGSSLLENLKLKK